MVYAKPVIQSFDAEALEQEIEAGASCVACSIMCLSTCALCQSSCIACEYVPFVGAAEPGGWEQDFDADYS